MVKKYAPIVIFAYNRLDHLQETLHALEQAAGADDSEVFIYADGYKGDKDKERVLAVHNFLKAYEQKHPYKSLSVLCKEQNQGLEKSVIGGVGEILEKYGKVIVLEDDLIVSKDFLCFMNQALEYYEKNPNIWQISAWTENVPELKELEEDTYLWYRCNSWGWATWLDRWQKIDWEVRDYRNFRFSPSKRRKLNRGGADMSDMLDMQMQDKIHSWAIRFAYAECKNNMLTVFPKDTRVRNAGRDGSGTNCHEVMVGVGAAFTEETEKTEKEFCFGETVLKGRLNRLVYRSYSGSRLHCLKWRIKSILNRLGVRKF